MPKRAGRRGWVTDLGSDFYDTSINPERRRRNHIRQLALGYKVIPERAA